jgi:hypothetical protein
MQRASKFIALRWGFTGSRLLLLRHAVDTSL